MTTTPSLSSEHKENLRNAKKELEKVKTKLQENKIQDLAQHIERASSLIASVQL